MNKTFAKKYRILSLLGTGGMSEVYLAQNIKTGTKVALKILDSKLSKEEDYIERFKREVEISKTLSHPNIVRIMSFGTDKGRYYIIYEYIEGLTLDKYIKSKKLSIKEIEGITLQILNGLSYARSKSIIHRDIKPSNIMISKEGKVKILDFGIARATTKSTITKTGMFMGSPHYTSPEQIDGKKIDHRTDIYSLGIVLYEMVEGKVPFEADTPLGFVRAHLDKSVPSIKRDIPDYLRELIYKCLAKDPSDRFSSAEEISNAIKLKSCADKTVIKAIRSEKPREVKKPLSSRKIIGITTGSLAIVAIIYIIILAIAIYAPGEQKVDEVVDIPSDFEPVKIIDLTTTKPGIFPNDSTEIFIKYEEYYSEIETIWSCSAGSITSSNKNSATWHAPGKTGVYTISVTSNLFGTSDSSSRVIYVINEEKDEVIISSNDNNDSTSTQNTTSTDYTQMNAEDAFLDKVYYLLDEYNAAFNHMDTYHKEGWIFNEPAEIALEETFLIKLGELSNKLVGFSYPQSYSTNRSNLINIANEILSMRNQQVQRMKNNDYDNTVYYYNKSFDSYAKLHDYYNSMVNEYNRKY